MQMTQSHKPFKKINYYPLNNGFVDVYLHKNETQEVDEEGNIQYVAEEVHFQIDVKTTKEMIEENFDVYWENEGERVVTELSAVERIEMLEDTINFLLGL